ncbi:SDR family oxidoreductase [Lacticaseibacillus thailandensis]|uniref:Oxidoreductase n=1 Tax=Lacticaseibacillus thailandensis DSM 22698 = JCM 13996 TaxID=1423810 RepID=A0A0R2C744_9LACO|nr:oxidoreductase [Lacticaseibacillus thailandensis DSM 22698 = JCM 13996]
MKVFVIGATGRVGQDLITALTQAGHTVTAGVHTPSKFKQGDLATPVAFDLTAAPATMATILTGYDAVYFVAGSRGRDLLQVEEFGAIKSMQAAEQAGVKRYVMLSSLFATQPEKWAGITSLASLADYNVAKFVADNWLMRNTQLDYTIIQPGTLTETPATGRVTLGVTDGGQNAIPDVAAVLAAVLEQHNTFGQVITMHAGDTPVAEAVANWSQATK